MDLQLSTLPLATPVCFMIQKSLLHKINHFLLFDRLHLCVEPALKRLSQDRWRRLEMRYLPHLLMLKLIKLNHVNYHVSLWFFDQSNCFCHGPWNPHPTLITYQRAAKYQQYQPTQYFTCTIYCINRLICECGKSGPLCSAASVNHLWIVASLLKANIFKECCYSQGVERALGSSWLFSSSLSSWPFNSILIIDLFPTW